MNRKYQKPRRLNRKLLSCALVSCLLMSAPIAFAQNTTASIRGKVAASAQITATNTANGAVRRVNADANGNYALVGLQPGTYRIDATAAGASTSKVVSVQVGQATTLNLTGAAPAPTAPVADATNLETVTVTAAALIETKTSEVATNITQTQIENLPQNNRNFLNFAALAPGVTITNSDTSKTFSAAGQPANQINVFIDGASQKNNVLQGGLVGQDASKGNPFSQEAVQEFRVLTQNFKAEYEQAGSAVITAITKSGTNEFHGSIYGFYQDKSMVEKDYFEKKNNEDKADYERKQYGATLGGPIIKDKLHFFVSYEANREDANARVGINDPDFSHLNGVFPRPFEEDVWFGKLSWIATENDDVDLSFTRRRDSEAISFGGTTAYDARQNRDIEVDDALLKWKHYGDGWLNEMSLGRGEFLWSPNAANPGLIAQDLQGCCRIGGANLLQQKGQENWTFRNDFTLSDIDWHGNHVVKMGVKYAMYEMNLLEQNNANPLYLFNRDRPGGFDSPFQVQYSPVGKRANLDNDQIGLYIQDDWDVTDRLQLNLGLRWDYETDPYNKNYVTPQTHIDVINALGLSHDYISTGDNREPAKDMFQPRLGFSYDFSEDNDESWVLFGGAGRYYDRTPLDNAIQEQFHAVYPDFTIWFSPDGSDVDGNPAVMWDPKYFNKSELDALVSGPGNFSSEIDLLNNETKSPYSDQYSLGVRSVMGDWNASITLSHVLGKDQFTWIWGNRLPSGDFISPLPNGLGPVLINTTKDYEADSLFVTLDKPYDDESGWGIGFSYTFQDASKEGGDAYSLDYVSPELYPENRIGAHHRLVANGMFKLPWDMRLSALGTFATGDVYNVNYNFDYNGGPNGPSNTTGIHLGGGRKAPYKTVDLALTKDFKWGQSQALQLRLDAFNIFNSNNFDCYESSYTSENFGQPSCMLPQSRSARSFQVGARYSF